MSLFEKALWVIERNSDQALSLNAIAAACNVSRSHLANAFGTASGWSVKGYLRARRLSDAAQKLADGAPDILRLAIDSGYGSHEAFTRAFRDHFGKTPEQVRRRASVEGLRIVDALRLSSTEVDLPAPRLAQLGRLRLVGLSALCSFREVMKIPAQWQHFATEFYFAIPSKTPRMPIGVCDVPSEDGTFRYVCAVDVAAFEDRNPELTYLAVEPGDYAVFEHQDHVSRIFDTYSAIWNRALPEMARRVADSPVLEFHNDTFDPATGLGGVQIWIPLEKV
jgi:AraC family transcriptional regulator